MYLNLLSDNDKKYFLAIANRIVNIDSLIDDSEIKLLETFKNEMKLTEVDYLPELEFDEIVDSITNDAVVHKIVIFELLYLTNIDEDCSAEELLILEAMRKKWEISDEIYDELQTFSRNLLEISKTILS